VERRPLDESAINNCIEFHRRISWWINTVLAKLSTYVWVHEIK